MRITLLLCVVLILNCSFISDAKSKNGHLSNGNLVFETSPAFNPYARADVYLNEKNGKAYLHISRIFIKHNEALPEKEIQIRSISLNVSYFNEDGFCYVSSGKKICKPADWENIPADAPAEINKILSKGKTLEVNHLNIEFDRMAHHLAMSQKLKLSLSLNINKNSSVTLTNITDFLP